MVKTLLILLVSFSANASQVSGGGGGGTIGGGTGSTDNALLRADGTGGVTSQGSTVTLGDTGAISNVLTGNVVGLTIQKNAGATANLTEWYDSTPTLVAYTKNNGSQVAMGYFFVSDPTFGFTTDYIKVNGEQILLSSSSDLTIPAFDMVGTNTSSNHLAMVRIQSQKSGNRGLIVQGYTSQSVNIFETRDVSDNLLTSISPTALILNNEHLTATQTTKPTAAVGANAGTGASSTVVNNSSDVAGQFTITSGSVGTPGTGTQTTISYNVACTNGSFVVISPADQNAAIAEATLGIYDTPSASGFVIGVAVALGTSTLYTWNYHATCY